MSLSPHPEQQRLEARRLAWKIFLVSIPALFLLLALEILAWTLAETRSLEWNAAWQSQHPENSWRNGDGRSNLLFKVARIRHLSPEIVFAGSSRGNYFSEKSFRPYTFYSAGLTCWTFDHYRRFLELIIKDGYKPRIFIFNLDYWMFIEGFDKPWDERFYDKPVSHTSALKFVLTQFLKRPYELLRSLPNTRHFHGIYAILNKDGFLQDGSARPIQPTDDFTRLESDNDQPWLADHVSDIQKKSFEKFVASAKANDVKLIGIQLPYYRKLLNIIENNPKSGVWREFNGPDMASYFAKLDVEFYNYSDDAKYTTTPSYWLDLFHPAAPVVADIMARIRQGLPDPLASGKL